MAIVIHNKFERGEKVYLVTDREQMVRLVTAIKICADDGILYELMCGTQVSWHYDIEISIEKDTFMAANA
jgi:hypothetical protein